MPSTDTACAGIILCGGESRRMGRPKEELEFGDEAMLTRVARILGGVTRPLIVVASNQKLPPLPSGTRVVHDRESNRGPLEGLAVGLAEAAQVAPLAFVCSCDAPLLRPELVRRLISLIGSAEVCIPGVDGQLYPLSAIYRTSLATRIEPLLESERAGPLALVDRSTTRIVRASELADVDPELQSLMNVNSPEDYQKVISLMAGSPGLD